MNICNKKKKKSISISSGKIFDRFVIEYIWSVVTK